MRLYLRRAAAALLCVVLLFAGLPFAAGAGTYPESAHPYPNGVTDVQTYADPAAERGVFVTFSEDTWVEPLQWRVITVTPAHPEFTVGDLISPSRRTGDYIALLDENGNTLGSYTGGELAGKTVYLPVNSFRILLSADAENNGYGYKITAVRPAERGEVRRITLHAGFAGGGSERYLAERGAGACFPWGCEIGGSDLTRDGFAFAGWSAVPGGPVDWDPRDPIPEGDGDFEAWAVWTPLALRQNEVLSFSNSSWYFEGDGRENYYMTAEDYRAMQLNLYKNYGLGPVPGPVLSAVLSTYPDWEFRGSCYGMSAVVALQHLGAVDLLSAQGAACMADLKADDALISRINYYQSQAATSWLTENKAYDIGSAGYRAQLRRLTKAVERGNIVLFTFYPGEVFRDTGHTVLFTGGYRRADGAHVLIAYDCNDSWSYLSGEHDTRFTVAADFGSIADDWDDEIGAFNWTDNFTQFEPFNADVQKGSPVKWYAALLKHIAELFYVLRTVLRAR